MPYILCEMDDHSVTSWSDDEDIINILDSERDNFVPAHYAPVFPSRPLDRKNRFGSVPSHVDLMEYREAK